MPDDHAARLRAAETILSVLKQRVQDHEGDIHSFARLPIELEKIRWGQEKMQESLDAAHDAIRDMSARIDGVNQRIDQEHKERVEGQADRKRELEEAVEARKTEMARIEADRERQYQEIQSRADQAKLESRRMLLGLMGIFLTSVASVLAALLTGGPT